MEERPCSSCQTRPAAAQIPGRKVCSVNLNIPEPLISFCRMIYSALLFVSKNDASLGNGKQAREEGFFFFFFLFQIFFAGRLGSIFAPFHFSTNMS